MLERLTAPKLYKHVVFTKENFHSTKFCLTVYLPISVNVWSHISIWLMCINNTKMTFARQTWVSRMPFDYFQSKAPSTEPTCINLLQVFGITVTSFLQATSPHVKSVKALNKKVTPHPGKTTQWLHPCLICQLILDGRKTTLALPSAGSPTPVFYTCIRKSTLLIKTLYVAWLYTIVICA